MQSNNHNSNALGKKLAEGLNGIIYFYNQDPKATPESNNNEYLGAQPTP